MTVNALVVVLLLSFVCCSARGCDNEIKGKFLFAIGKQTESSERMNEKQQWQTVAQPRSTGRKDESEDKIDGCIAEHDSKCSTSSRDDDAMKMRGTS
jgi:hypothetical protein